MLQGPVSDRDFFKKRKKTKRVESYLKIRYTVNICGVLMESNPNPNRCDLHNAIMLWCIVWFYYACQPNQEPRFSAMYLMLYIKSVCQMELLHSHTHTYTPHRFTVSFSFALSVSVSHINRVQSWHPRMRQRKKKKNRERGRGGCLLDRFLPHPLSWVFRCWLSQHCPEVQWR